MTDDPLKNLLSDEMEFDNTGLGNLQYLQVQFNLMVEEANLLNSKFAFTVIELEHFDNLQNDEQSKLMSTLARRFKTILPQNAVIARIENNFLVILWSQVENINDIEVQIEEVLAKNTRLGNNQYALNYGINTQIYPEHGIRFLELKMQCLKNMKRVNNSQ